jgi:gamma-tubulin complex component 2
MASRARKDRQAAVSAASEANMSRLQAMAQSTPKPTKLAPLDVSGWSPLGSFALSPIQNKLRAASAASALNMSNVQAKGNRSDSIVDDQGVSQLLLADESTAHEFDLLGASSVVVTRTPAKNEKEEEADEKLPMMAPQFSPPKMIDVALLDAVPSMPSTSFLSSAANRNSNVATVASSSSSAVHLDLTIDLSVAAASSSSSHAADDHASSTSTLVDIDVPVSIHSRPFSNFDYLLYPTDDLSGANVAQQPLGAVLDDVSVVDDLLYALMGIEGHWIVIDRVESDDDDDDDDEYPLKDDRSHSRSNPNDDDGDDGEEMNFILVEAANDRLSSTARELVARMLPLCGQYVRVARYAHEQFQYAYGMVAHALGGALEAELDAYLAFVASLSEAPQPSVEMMWVRVQPHMASMRLLDRLRSRCTETESSGQGGRLLNVLYEWRASLSGDAHIDALLRSLLAKSATPYLAMLSSWIRDGELRDPHGEFMVLERGDADEWRARFSLQLVDHIPIFLRRLSTCVLTTGKALTAIRLCGLPIERQQQSDDGEQPATIEFSGEPREFDAVVERAYQRASSALLGLLRERCQLSPQLAAIKHFFTVARSDFVEQFVGVASELLEQPAADVRLERLQPLLELALRSSIADESQERTAALLRCQLLDKAPFVQLFDTSSSSESTALTGFDAFALHYGAEWPLSIVVHAQAHHKLVSLFRHLFLCKRVQLSLSATWLAQQHVNEMLSSPGASRNEHRTSFVRAFCLRRHMHLFVDQLLHYMNFEVVEPNYARFEQQLVAARTVEDVLRDHDAFLERTLSQCLLTDRRLVRSLSKLLSICSIFCTYVQRSLHMFGDVLEQLESTDGDASSSSSTKRRTERTSSTMARQRRERLESATRHAIGALVASGFPRIVDKFHVNFTNQLDIFLDALRSLTVSTSLFQPLASFLLHFD